MAQPPSVLPVLLFVIVLLFVHPPSVLLVLLFVIVLLFVHPDCITICSSAQRASGVAASSSSFAPFDVFINHRGPDVKNTLASLLYHELKSRGLQVFLDRPELEPGHIIISQIKAAIEGASVHVAIFSPKYAESKWCLDELVHMINSTGKILPVFYKVKPSELRWTDKGAYADALRKHKEQQRYDLGTIEEWKNALSHVADISGFELDACNGDEVELVDKVVQRVLKEVPKPLHVAKYQIGLQEKLEDFERKVLSQLEEEGRQEAKVVGIVGLGGIGKSTLARIFFNRKRSNYSHSSFLADVRENEARKSITSLQSQLIKDLRGRDISISSREEGIGELEKNLKSCHSLIILDDVDHLHQLDALIFPIRYVLDPKSLILITSRDKHVLRTARITDSSIYQLKALDTPHSLELFCCHAFFQPHPLPQFEDLVDGFVKACHGLPLSLQVFGALLCQENDTAYWEEQLNELQTLPPEIEVRLKISYDSLNKQEKQIFLDIACFSIGHDKDKWIRIWGGSRWKGSVGLRNLENKCLIEVDAENKIRMHDHLRDMGRNIAAEDLSMPRRIWGAATVKDVYDLLEQSLSCKQKIEVRGIIMPPQWDTFTNAWKERSFTDEVFRRISKLELLVGAEDFVEGLLSKVRAPNLNLLWLHYIGCTSSSLPSCIPMGDLRVLEVSWHYMEERRYYMEILRQRVSEPLLKLRNLQPLLKLRNLQPPLQLRILQPPLQLRILQPPLQLRELNIQGIQFSEFPNSLSQLQHLEKIALGEQQLSALPEELCHLPSLQYLKLERCTKLQTLPHSFGNLTNLKSINLTSSYSLEVLPNAFGTLTNLREINLKRCKKLKMLPDFSENLLNIQVINLAGCESLEVVPNAIGAITNLREIDLTGCKKLKMLPDFSENLLNIQEINLVDCESLEVLPDSIANLRSVQKINLERCKNLKMLPDFSENLLNIQEINLAGCESLEVLPDSIQNLRSLQKINLKGCESLEVLPNAFENCTNLREINLAGWKKMNMLPNFMEKLKNITEINLAGCECLEVLPDSIGNLTNVQMIHLEGCTSLEVLPNAFGTLTNLREINLAGCKKLKMLPDFSENLLNIQEINLAGCECLEVLPDSIQNLRSLQKINLKGCESLEVLPNAFENFTNLREINLAGWKKMNMLPNFMGKLKNITKINLAGCECLEVLPDSIGNLTNVQMIHLEGCTSLEVLPNAFGTLTNLREINLAGCKTLKMLPDFSVNLLNIQEINLAGCESLEVLPDSIQNLRSLQKINLKGCESLEVLPNAFENFTNLREINLAGWKKMNMLPNFMEKLKNITKINLAGCGSLEVLPNSIENLTNLQNINLENCKSLKVLPNSIENLINLRAINLEGCECLELLPNSFGNLTNLEYIDASQSFNLQSPSDLLGNLLQLKHLHLSCCSSLTISNETLGNITTLECLDLSGCLQLEVLPLQVLHQSFLKRLNLLSTNIKEMPSVPTVCLSNLEELILGSPLLKVLPPWLGCLKSLRKLLLHGCRKLKCLPDSVGQLSQMRELEISKCGIQYLPAAVMQLNNLEILRVRGCPLRELPFKRVEGDGEPSLVLDSSIHTGLMDRLKEIDLYLTDILEVSFPEGVCANLEKLKITWCNDLVEVGALPTTLVSLDLRGCGALRKIGLAGLSKLEEVDMRGCCAVEVEELPGLESVICLDILRRILRSLRILKTPFETYYPGEVDKDVRAMAALQEGRLEFSYFCPLWWWWWY